MTDLTGLRAATFRPHVGTAFAVRLSDADDVPLTLVAVDEAPEQPHAPRPDPFSLTFTGPAGLGFTQGLYALHHDTLGRLDLFLVPRQPAADGLPRLEAVFN